VTEKLGYRKLCACRVLEMLMEDHKMNEFHCEVSHALRTVKEMTFWTPL
jgi:hypothetical protein